MTTSLLKRFDELVKGRMPADMMLVEISRPEWEAHIELCKDFFRAALLEMKGEAERLRYIRPDQSYPLSEYEKVNNAAVDSFVAILTRALEE